MNELKFQRLVESSTILLTGQEGTSIKNLIKDRIGITLPEYCKRIGILPPQFYAILSGQRRCTLDMLNKILSGISANASLDLNLVIQVLETGQDVLDVDSHEQDVPWSFEETEMLDEEL
jgi:predicted transcriptional regulator